MIRGTPDTEEERTERFNKEAQRRKEDAAAEDRAMDAMVRRASSSTGLNPPQSMSGLGESGRWAA